MFPKEQVYASQLREKPICKSENDHAEQLGFQFCSSESHEGELIYYKSDTEMNTISWAEMYNFWINSG